MGAVSHIPRARAKTTRGFLLAWACVLMTCLVASSGRAEESKDGSRANGRASTNGESYEWERTRKVLEQQELSLAEAPEGKKIAWVRIVSDDVFVKDELWPLWFNWFHAKTRESVVRRELLFQSGEPFRDARIEATMPELSRK